MGTEGFLLHDVNRQGDDVGQRARVLGCSGSSSGGRRGLHQGIHRMEELGGSLYRLQELGHSLMLGHPSGYCPPSSQEALAEISE